jgi:hypothetical protein
MKIKAIKRLIIFKLKRLYRYLMINFKLSKRKFKLSWKFKKKKITIKYLVIISLSLLTFFSLRNKIQIVDKSTHTKEVIFADTTNTLEEFLFQLRQIESANNHLARRTNYTIIKTSHGPDTVTAYSQYIGYYQLGYAARKSASEICPSLNEISTEEFWNSEFYQHKSTICWFLYLKKILNKEIMLYSDKFFGTFYITESGLIGMSHLVGPTTVKNWLKSGRYDIFYTYRIMDGNYKKGVDYLQQLGRYNLRLDRFLDDKGKLLENELNKFVQNIVNNKNIKDVIIEEISMDDKYEIIDSIDDKKDSIKFNIPTLKKN